MRLERFTEKSQDALQTAAREAQEHGQQAIEPEHLLLALVRQERLEEVRQEAERAERAADFERAARLRYGEVAELERQLADADRRLNELQAQGALLKEEVDEEDIAQIVARWTGIPVSRLMTGEIQKAGADGGEPAPAGGRPGRGGGGGGQRRPALALRSRRSQPAVS
jgi:ATP-dependent Clp protease ATP-binding subunit ClpB